MNKSSSVKVVSVSLPIQLARRLEREENKSKTIAAALSSYFLEQRLTPRKNAISKDLAYFDKLRREKKIKPFGSIESIVTAKNHGRK